MNFKVLRLVYIIFFCFEANANSKVESLLKAIWDNNPQKVRQLIRKGANVNVVGREYKETPLGKSFGGKNEI